MNDGERRQLTVMIGELDGQPSLRLAGEIDSATAAEFRSSVDAAITASDADLVIDLTALTFIDSSGIAQLVSAARRLDKKQRRLVLYHPKRSVARVIQISGLASLAAVELRLDA